MDRLADRGWADADQPAPGSGGERRILGQLLATSGCQTGTARASTGLGNRPWA